MRAPNLIFFLAVAFSVLPANAQPRFGFGKPITEEQAKPWNIDVLPDGTGLPKGKGSVSEGEKIYADNCAACHGENTQNPLKGIPRLSGGSGTLASAKPVQTLGSYWPYATTIYDYINRSMPFNAPQTLTHDEVYSVVAYLLYKNEIVSANAVLDAKTLSQIKMPNADGFIPDGRPDTDDSVCKKDCK